ncbi:hypothetical protein ACROYT_G044749 [Oculina patagonica]
MTRLIAAFVPTRYTMFHKTTPHNISLQQFHMKLHAFTYFKPLTAQAPFFSAVAKQVSRMNTLVVAILWMLCLMIHSLGASPVSKGADVEEYRVRIYESGTEFNETVTIDENQQTELFKVPAHNNVEKSDIMFDFKMNATMIHFPLRSVCFLLPLARDQPTPKNLVRNLQQVASNDVITHKETVMADKEITDRSILSDSTASLCSKSRIFQVVKLPSERIVVTNLDNAHTRPIRRKRSMAEPCKDAMKSVMEVVNTCPGNPFPQYKVKCKVETESCAWLVDCPGLGGWRYEAMY